jgi:hypothetical protein
MLEQVEARRSGLPTANLNATALWMMGVSAFLKIVAAYTVSGGKSDLHVF